MSDNEAGGRSNGDSETYADTLSHEYPIRRCDTAEACGDGDPFRNHDFRSDPAGSPAETSAVGEKGRHFDGEKYLTGRGHESLTGDI